MEDFRRLVRHARPHEPAGDPRDCRGVPDRSRRRRPHATVGRRLAAIVFAHRLAGAPPPTEQVGNVLLDHAMRSIRRAGRERPQAQKRAADGDILRDMLRAIEGDSIRSVRDRALLAIRMGGEFRREQVVELSEGLDILVPRAPCQVGPGGPRRHSRHPRPPHRAIGLYRTWIEAATIDAGPVFRKLTRRGD